MRRAWVALLVLAIVGAAGVTVMSVRSARPQLAAPTDATPASPVARERRLAPPLTETRRIGLAPGVVALRVVVAGRGFDVLTTARPADIAVTPSGPRGGSVRQLARELAAKKMDVFLVMNAGMYHPGYRPVGLLVSGGELVSPLRTGPGQGNFFLLPNGVFAVAGDGRAVVIEATTSIAAQLERAEVEGTMTPYSAATQSGPLLLERGRPHPAIDPDSSHRVVRNAVGISGSAAAVFVISNEPVTFFELTSALAALGCRDAVHLDGVVSSAYLPAFDRDDGDRRLGPLVSVSRRLVGVGGGGGPAALTP